MHKLVSQQIKIKELMALWQNKFKILAVLLLVVIATLTASAAMKASKLKDIILIIKIQTIIKGCRFATFVHTFNFEA
jgi:hypothetical protein